MQKSARNFEVKALEINTIGVVLTNIQILKNSLMQPPKIKHATFKVAYLLKEDN
ncbi:hypothetical protein JCM15124A_20310 [Prevotella falsenii]